MRVVYLVLTAHLVPKLVYLVLIAHLAEFRDQSGVSSVNGLLDQIWITEAAGAAGSWIQVGRISWLEQVLAGSKGFRCCGSGGSNAAAGLVRFIWIKGSSADLAGFGWIAGLFWMLSILFFNQESK
jgi:hypothetical protein